MSRVRVLFVQPPAGNVAGAAATRNGEHDPNASFFSDLSLPYGNPSLGFCEGSAEQEFTI